MDVRLCVERLRRDDRARSQCDERPARADRPRRRSGHGDADNPMDVRCPVVPRHSVRRTSHRQSAMASTAACHSLAGCAARGPFFTACMQLPTDTEGNAWREGHVPVSEDCLYLNIWTPARSASDRLPVMVFIHGGGNTRGAASENQYDGAYLAKKGVVFVSFNYRMNVFGFLAHPDLTRESAHHSSGNYA